METYLDPTVSAPEIQLDYLVSPRPHVDRVTVHFDHDELAQLDDASFSLPCPKHIPLQLLRGSSPIEEVRSATITMWSSVLETSRRGRVVLSTGSQRVDLDAGTLPATTKPWWMVFEPAAGAPRVLVQHMDRARDVLRFEHLPTSQPGTIAVIQSDALVFDPATRTTYAPGDFSREWRRYATTWHGTMRIGPSLTPARLATVIPEGRAVALIHETDREPALKATSRALLTLPSGKNEFSVSIDCSAPLVKLMVLSFTDAVAGPDAAPVPVRLTEAPLFSGGCAAGQSAWLLPIRAVSLNGRPGSLLIARAEEMVW